MKPRKAALIAVVATPVALLMALIGFRVAVLGSEHLQHNVLERICSGGTLSLYLAKASFSGHAHFNEEIASALSAALRFSPEPIPSSYGADFCFEPEHLPESCNTTHWKAASLEALAKVTDESLASTVSACRATIEST